MPSLYEIFWDISLLNPRASTVLDHSAPQSLSVVPARRLIGFFHGEYCPGTSSSKLNDVVNGMALIGFKYNNWKPVTNINKIQLNRLNKKFVHNLIDKRLSSQKYNGNIQYVTVYEIILKWCFSKAGDELIPAFVHFFGRQLMIAEYFFNRRINSNLCNK